MGHQQRCCGSAKRNPKRSSRVFDRRAHDSMAASEDVPGVVKSRLRVAPAHQAALNVCSCDTAVTSASAAITDDIDWNILAQSNFSDDFLNRGETIERLLADCPYCRYASLVGTGLASGND